MLDAISCRFLAPGGSHARRRSLTGQSFCKEWAQQPNNISLQFTSNDWTPLLKKKLFGEILDRRG